MGSKNTTSLTLAGDEKQLSRALQSGASDVDDFAKDVGKSSDQAVRKLNEINDAADAIKPAELKVLVDTGKGQADLDKLGKAGQDLKPAKLPVKVDDDGVVEGLRKVGDVGADAFSGSFLGALAGGDLVGGITDMITEGLDAVGEQKNLVADIQNSMGISPDEAQKYGDRIGKAYANGLGESKEDIAGVYSLLSSDVKDWADRTEEAQDQLAKRQVKLNDAIGKDGQASIAAVSSAYTNKLVPSFEDAQDLLLKGYQTLGARGDDWAETLQEYSGYFAQLGITGPQALGLIQQGLQAGARDTDFVADVWKEAGIRLIDTADTTRDALKDLFKDPKLNVENFQRAIASGGPPAEAALEKVITKLQGIKDPVEKNRIGVALFGTQYEDTFRRVIEQTDLAAAKTTEFQGVTDKLADHHRTLTEQIGAFWDKVNLKVGTAIETITNEINNGTFIDSLSLALRVADGDLTEAEKAAYKFGVSLDGTNRGINDLAASVGGYGSPAFVDLTKKMSDSDFAALGVTRTVDSLGRTVLNLPASPGHPIVIDTNAGRVITDLNTVTNLVNRLPTGPKFLTYFIDTVVRGPNPGANNLPLPFGGHAEGGFAHGPGSHHQDKFLSALSDNEFVVNAEDSMRNARQLKALNSGKSWAEAGGVSAVNVMAYAGPSGPSRAEVVFSGGLDSAMATTIMRLINTGQIQIKT